MQKKSMLDLHRVDVEQYKTVEKIPVAVVLDDVRSEMNVGSVAHCPVWHHRHAAKS